MEKIDNASVIIQLISATQEFWKKVNVIFGNTFIEKKNMYN